MFGDLHEFKITDDDTALLTVYDRMNVDLTTTEMTGIKDGSIVDCVIQEVDIASGELVFQWRASDHLDNPYLHASYGDYVSNNAFDYFHVNSVDKDSHGNYLTSVRHLHKILCINGTSGAVIWALGGHSTDFDDISGGAATNFKWQHDARWVSEEQGIISLFNNGIARKHYSDAQYSQGLVIRLDLANRTAELLHSYPSLQHISSTSQGSLKTLPTIEERNPHVFIGWGSSAAYSEFNPEGKLLCETHFGASLFYYFERAKSYRAIKASAWQAQPAWDPSAKTEGGSIYISWNGATDVAWWALQGVVANLSEEGRPSEEDDFEDVDVIPKVSFESLFDLASDAVYTLYRVAALDAEMNVLRYSNITYPISTQTRQYVWATVLIAAISAITTVLFVRYRSMLQQMLVEARGHSGRARYRRLG